MGEAEEPDTIKPLHPSSARARRPAQLAQPIITNKNVTGNKSQAGELPRQAEGVCHL